MGFRMVAQAAATRATEQSTEIANRVVVHGADLLTRASAVPAQQYFYRQRRTQQVNTMQAQQPLTSKTEHLVMATPTSPCPEPQNLLQRPNPTSNVEMESIYKNTSNGDTVPTIDDVHMNQSPVDPTVANVEIEPPSKLTSNEDTISNTADIHTIHSHLGETMVSNLQYERLKEGRPVPATRTGRAVGFAQLGVGLAFGALGEWSSRLVGGGSTSTSIIGTDANADRLSATLCRMRGAALKMGQMLSIQDETLLPPALTRALNQVRQGADAMPKSQLIKQMESQLGLDWRNLFVEFDELPFAAASIGQVHRAKLAVGSEIKDVVVKVQYPGVANSIESDLRNLTMLVKMTGLAPKGLFIDNVVRVGRDELKVECDYLRERDHQRRFKNLVESDPVLTKERFVVPDVYDELTTSEIITSEFCHGGTIDKVVHLSQEERNRIGTCILYLTIQELFAWRFMQTDPNWGNFLYDVGSGTTFLIDFGATREYSKLFVDGYLRIVCANANRDESTLMKLSHKMNFLTGEENDVMREAHKLSGFTVGEPFASDEPFNFRDSNISSRLGEHTSAFMQHRLTPPPEEVYTLHRKLAGAYMLCIKLGAAVDCRSLLRNVLNNHKFDDGMEPPKL